LAGNRTDSAEDTGDEATRTAAVEVTTALASQ
jgi:hypothetical protein